MIFWRLEEGEEVMVMVRVWGLQRAVRWVVRLVGSVSRVVSVMMLEQGRRRGAMSINCRVN